MRSPDSIVVHGLNWIGDAVMSLPTIHAVRKAMPSTRIIAASSGWSADVYRMSPHVDKVVQFTKKRGFAALQALQQSSSALKALGAVAALILPNSFSSALRCWLAGIPERIGYATDGRGLLLTKSCTAGDADDSHTVLRYRRLLRQCLEIDWSDDLNTITLEINDTHQQAANSLLEDADLPAGSYIAFSPGAAWGEAKAWPAEQYASAADRLMEKHPQLAAAFFGSPADADLIESIRSLMCGPSVSFAGTFSTLLEMAATLKLAAVLVCNDSGPMHLAAALGVPVVALFGPSDENRTGPWAPPSRAVILRAPDSKPWKRFRPGSKEPGTMHRITVERVVEAAENMIAAAKR